MKLVVFDVNNAACSLAISPNWYSMMVDCWSNSEKDCPVDIIKNNITNWWMKEINGYSLTLLHITHPDDDHIKNSEKVLSDLPPYLLSRRRLSEFSNDIYKNIDDWYKEGFDQKYIYEPSTIVDWWWETKIFWIPMQDIQNDQLLSWSIKNNSSYVRLIDYNWVRILFWWDMEKEWWDWLSNNDDSFISEMKKWINILIAPHHWHKSWFPKSLFDLTGNIDFAIFSKWSEDYSTWTDVSSQYNWYCKWIIYRNRWDWRVYYWYVLTTRANWQIEIDINMFGHTYIYTEKASSSHRCIS